MYELPRLPDAGYTVAKFTIIGSNLHVNILKYRIFVAKVVVNPNVQGWEIKCKGHEKLHWQSCQIGINIDHILTVILIYNILTFYT